MLGRQLPERLALADFSEISIVPHTHLTLPPPPHPPLHTHTPISGQVIVQRCGQASSCAAKSIPILAIDCDGRGCSSCRLRTHLRTEDRIFANFPSANQKFPGRGGGGDVPAGHHRFIISRICWVLLIRELILRDSSILDPRRDALFLWLVWLRKFTEKKQEKLSFGGGGIRAAGEITGAREPRNHRFKRYLGSRNPHLNQTAEKKRLFHLNQFCN